MIIREALREAKETLASSGIEEARLDSEILVRHVLDCNSTELYLQLDNVLPSEQERRLDQLIHRRLNHEPIAYITEHKEFFGIDFYVNHNTLIPRPETEILVEKALELANDHPSTIIVDVGTGCGAIAIALAAHLSQAQVYATDISASALEIASLNIEKHGLTSRIHLLQGDLLESISEPVDLIVANLPYISDPEFTDLSNDIRLFEPSLALSGGPDGLRQISRLLIQAKDKLRPGGSILLEIGQNQQTAIASLVDRYFPGAAVEVIKDLNKLERAILIEADFKKVATEVSNSI